MASLSWKSPTPLAAYSMLPNPGSSHHLAPFGVRPTPQYPRQFKHQRKQTFSTVGATRPAAGPRTPITRLETDGPSAKKRARSEPPNFGGTFDDDVNMVDIPTHSVEPTTGGSNPPLKRSQSVLDLSQMAYTALDWFLGKSQCPPVEELSEPESQSQSTSQSQSQSQPRSVSPALTEVYDPEPEYLATQLEAHGIKTRDFAHEPRISPTLPATRAVIPELFDQHEALAEFEYRVAQQPRLFPMNPKTLRRLLDIGWVTMEEIQERGQAVDLVELGKYDQSRAQHPFVLKWKGDRLSTRPSPEETASILATKRFMFARLDRMRRNAEAEAERRERDAWEVEQSMKSKGKGRALETGEKRKRFETEWEVEEWSQSQQKQYPAPLSSYDPEIYPEAASVIESQQLSQGRPAPPPRIDTPPLAELESQQRRHEQENRPNGLKRGLKRTLSRTQTFTQL